MLARELAKSKKIAALKTDRSRFIYTVLLPYTDKGGVAAVDPVALASETLRALPYTAMEIAESLDELAGVGLVKLYKHPDFGLLMQYERFEEFNTPDGKERAEYPLPEEEGSVSQTALAAFAETSAKILGKFSPEVEVEVELEVEEEGAAQEISQTLTAESSEARSLACMKGEPTERDAELFFAELLGRETSEHPQIKPNRLRWLRTFSPASLKDLHREAFGQTQKPPLYYFIDSCEGKTASSAKLSPRATEIRSAARAAPDLEPGQLVQVPDGSVHEVATAMPAWVSFVDDYRAVRPWECLPVAGHERGAVN